MLVLTILNTAIAPLIFIYIWKSRNEHRCDLQYIMPARHFCEIFKGAEHLSWLFPLKNERWQSKSFTAPWELISNFFIAPLPILKQCKTKAAAEAVFAIANLIASYCILYKMSLYFKELSQDRGRENSLKIFTPLPLIQIYQMIPLSAKSISLD